MSRNIGPWPLGMDVVSPDDALPRSQQSDIIACRDAYNVDIDRTGRVTSRPGLRRIATMLGLHSAWTREDGTAIYAGHDDQLVQLAVTSAGLEVIPLATLPSAQPLDFTDHLGEVVYSSIDTIGTIRNDGEVVPLIVPDAATPHLAADPIGGLYAGRYSVAMAWMDPYGREGGLSPLATVEVPEGGGIRLTFPLPPDGVRSARLYRTGQNGDVLYLVGEILPGMPSYLLGQSQRGRAADNMHLRAIRPGRIVRSWMGRLLTVRGRVLYFTEALRYHLHSPRFGFVQMPQPITFMEPVEGGVFVGQQDTVFFLDGTNPEDWRLRRTGGNPPVPHSSVRITSDLMDSSLQLSSGEHAVWLANNGYVIGTPTGTTVEPQSRRIRLPVSAAGWTAVLDRRLFTITP